MKLPVLNVKNLKGKRVFMRVDWNVPVQGLGAEDSLKVERTIPDIRALAQRGAVVIVATHLGRPKKREKDLSTRRLAPLVSHVYGLKLEFLDADLETKEGAQQAATKIKKAKPGTVFLLENVRFFKGEEENSPALAKNYAALANVFVNDAFASCHRSHASVVGVAKLLPHYAGPALTSEVENLGRLLTKPKRPYVAILGGAKLSTKIEALENFLHIADKVLVGPAMANVFLSAKKIQIGKSLVEASSLKAAKKLMKNPKIVLPLDFAVAKKLAPGAKIRAAKVNDIKKDEFIGDIGPETMRAWSAEIKKAKTLVWNGPVGVIEIPGFSHGSMLLARSVAARSKGSAFGVVGGGDLLSIALKCGMAEWFDHISTGGGAMLEFVVKKGKLPGLTALAAKK